MTGRAHSNLRVSLLRHAIRLGLTGSESVPHLRHRIVEAGIRTSLFVCATPRTGSRLLRGLLAGTGLVGEPAEDFGEVFKTQVLPAVGRAGFGDYVVRCVHRAGETGVFSTKIHLYQRDLFLHLLSLLRGAHGLSDGKLVGAVFPEPRFVWLRRDDVVAQSVSLCRAKQSGVWFHGEGVGREETFDFAGIDAAVRTAREQAEEWRRWFAASGVEPLEVMYEQLVADPARAVRAILSFAGVDVPRNLVLTARTRRQADAVSEEWIRRYRELAVRVEGS
jgi:LPS sulfotransferase NodH